MRKDKKLLLINNSYPTVKYPNASTYIVSIEEALKEAGFSVDKLVIYRKSYCKLFKIYQRLVFFIKVCLTRFYKYDIVYVNHYSNIYYLLFWKLLFVRKKVVVHWHGGDLVSSRADIKLALYCMKKNKIGDFRHIVPSVFFRGELFKKFSISSDKVMISPSGGVNMNVFQDKAHSKKPNVVNIGFPSGLSADKGIDLLYEFAIRIETFERELKMKVIIHLIDYGEEVEEWKSKLSNYQENIIIHKKMQKSKMVDFYNTIDVMFMLSKRESLGLVALESMSCGVPVIARDICAMSEFVRPNVSGELVPESCQVNDLKRAFIKIVSRIKEYDPVEIIDNNYSTNVVVNKYKKFLN